MTVAEIALPAISAGYWLGSAVLVACRSGRQNAGVADSLSLEPVTFFRPLKPGVCGLETGLRSFLSLGILAGDQVLIGADPGSPTFATAERIAAEFPNRDIRLVPCTSDACRNPKISRLIAMEPRAVHDRWIVLDSELVVQADELMRVRREWQSNGADAATAGYRFVGMCSLPEYLDAVAILQTLWPGLAISERAGKTPMLGALMAVRRGDVTALGGWRVLGDFLADDNQLGSRLAALGRRILLSGVVLSLAADRLTWRDYWRHQRRIAVTYRLANPWGYAGLFLTFGMLPTFVITALHSATPAAWGLLAAVVICRWVSTRILAGAVGPRIPAIVLVSVLSNVIEGICWIFGWLPSGVFWANREWKGRA